MLPDQPSIVRVVHHVGMAIQPPPPVNWCVQGLLAGSSLNIFVGHPGAKKSLLATDLAVCVALGKPWLGLPTVQKPVLFVDEEAGMQRLWARFHKALAGHAATPDLPLHFITFGNYDLASSDDGYDISGHAAVLGAGLIVIDSLSDVTRGLDENTVSSMSPVLANLRRIAYHSKAAVVVIHHANKRGLFRGSSSISASVDHMLEVDSPSNKTALTLRTLKARDVVPVSLTANAVFQPRTACTSSFPQARSSPSNPDISSTPSAMPSSCT